MAKVDVEGVVHTYAGNPKLTGESWSAEFPPLNTSAKFCVVKRQVNCIQTRKSLATAVIF